MALNAAASSFGLFALYAAGTGLAAAVFNQAIQWLRDYRARKRAGTDFALKSAAILERFAHACLDRASDLDRHAQLGHDPSNIRLDFPSLEEFPENQDGWLGLPKAQAATLINLRLELENKRRQCANDAWFEAPPDAISTYEKANTILAADAWFVARGLRETFGLPSHGKIDARDPQDHTTYFLEHRLNEIHAQEKLFQKQQREMHDRMLEAQHKADLEREE